MKQRKETTAIAFRASVASVAEIDRRAELAGMSRAEWVAHTVSLALAGGEEAANVTDGADLAARVAALEDWQRSQQGQPRAVPVARPAPAEKPATSNATHAPEVIAAAIKYRVEGMTFDEIANQLNADGLKPARAAAFKAHNVRRLLESPTHKAQRIAAGLKY